MSYDITQKVKVTNPASNIDWYYGGENGYWSSIEEAIANVPREVRQIGKTIAILDKGSVVEYWWKSGIEDSDLVLKFGYNSTIINNYTDTYTSLNGVTSVTIPKSTHNMGNYPFVQTWLNGELALFDVTNNDGDITISWNTDITNNDVVSVYMVASERGFLCERGEVNSFNILASVHNMGDYPFVQTWLNGKLVLADVRNDNGDIIITWNNGISLEDEFYVTFNSDVYTNVFTNPDNATGVQIGKAVHGKGDNPIIQCYLGDELALFDVFNNNGDLVVSWNDESEVSALQPLRVVIIEQKIEHQSITYDINDLVVIGEKNVGDGGITTTKSVGGVASGKFLEKNTLLNKLLRDILSPTLNPTIVEPSVNLTTPSDDRVFECGSTNEVTFDVGFNRGSISPAYGTNGKRSGVAEEYGLMRGSEIVSTKNTNVFTDDVSLFDDENKPMEGFLTYRGVVKCADGEQPKDSNGDNYLKPFTILDNEGNENPLVSDDANSITFEFAYPIYANTDISHLDRFTSQLVSKKQGYAIIDFPLQTRENRFTFAVASSFEVNGIYYYNPVAQDWYGVNKKDDFNVVNDGEINSNITYKKYSMKGDDAKGEIKVKITWNV